MPFAEEDFEDAQNSLKYAIKGERSTIQTSMPGIIKSFDAAKQTAVVQLVIQSIRETDTDPDKIEYKTIPPLNDVPVEFPSGGGFTLTFPVTAGDECMVDFSSRNLDGWWDQGGIQPPLHPRQHDLSDAVCRVGVRSKGRAIAAKAGVAQLRSDDGTLYLELASGGVANIVAPGGFNVTVAAMVAAFSASGLKVTGGDIQADNISLKTHKTPTAPSGPVSEPVP